MPSPPLDVAVLLSGGLDSTVALHWALRHHRVACALSFDYGSNHAHRELECARKQAALAGIAHHVIDLTNLSRHLSSALLSGAEAIPTGSYADDNMKQTVVPFRNGIFLAIAAGIAESANCRGLVIAAHAGDHTIYPDCREEFMAAMSAAIGAGTYAGLQVLRPFIHADKSEIVRVGSELGVDFSGTYSCYRGGDQHCGLCATCRERREAFLAACVPDPTEYEADPTEHEADPTEHEE